MCSGWQQKDFGISSTKHARDFGVDVSFGSRAVPIGRKRVRRACIRSGRIRCFATKNQRACRLLFKGGALPQSTCGQQIRAFHNGHETSVSGCILDFFELDCAPPRCFPSLNPSNISLLSCVLARPPIVDQEKWALLAALAPTFCESTC